MATAQLQHHMDEFHTNSKPACVPRTDDMMSKEERYVKLEHSYAQSLAAAGRSYGKEFAQMVRSGIVTTVCERDHHPSDSALYERV